MKKLLFNAIKYYLFKTSKLAKFSYLAGNSSSAINIWPGMYGPLQGIHKYFQEGHKNDSKANRRPTFLNSNVLDSQGTKGNAVFS